MRLRRWTPRSKKERTLYRKFDVEINSLHNKLYDINKEIEYDFSAMITLLIDSEDINSKINEENFMNYVHSVIDFLSKKHRELKDLVDSSSVIDAHGEIQKAWDILQERKKHRYA